MGPVFGAIFSVVCAGIYFATGNTFWAVLGSWAFFVNLLNLAPTVPLDGGWIAPLFSPRLLAFGSILLLVLFHNNPMVWVFFVMSLPRVIQGWKNPGNVYYQVSPKVRRTYAFAYMGLALFLGAGYWLLEKALTQH